MRERQPKAAEVGERCERCGKWNATRLVDIHAVVVKLGVKMCTRCCNITLIRFPASSAVHIRRYE